MVRTGLMAWVAMLAVQGLAQGGTSVSPGAFARAKVDPIEKAFQGIKAAHPRLTLTSTRVTELKTLIRRDALLASWYQNRIAYVAPLLGTPPRASEWLQGAAWYSQSNLELARGVLDRIEWLGLFWQMTNDPRYATQGRLELLAASSAVDWSPDDILANGEMLRALATGYDWLWSALTIQDRQPVQRALARGIAWGSGQFAENAWWSRTPYNANAVINSGLLMAALSISDSDSALAVQAARQALASVKLSLGGYGASGGWIEGWAYWDYATRYLAASSSALDNALKTDLGISASLGLSRAGDFKLYLGGLTPLCFNFADSTDDNHPSAELFWLSRRYNKPAYAYLERLCVSRRGPSAMDFVWYDARGSEADVAKLVSSKLFPEEDVAMLRASWKPADLAVGFKGGDNGANHSHPDLGTFVLDALGQRWAIDLGYGDGGYRSETRGHNVLVAGGCEQPPTARAKVVEFSAGATRSYAIVDLVEASPTTLPIWRRGASLVGGSYALIQDEFVAAPGTAVLWSMQTRADVAVSGAEAVLTQGGQSVTAVILQPSTAVFGVEPVGDLVPGDPMVRRLQIQLTGDGGPCRLVVAFIPVQPGQPSAKDIAVSGLDGWKAGKAP